MSELLNSSSLGCAVRLGELLVRNCTAQVLHNLVSWGNMHNRRNQGKTLALLLVSIEPVHAGEDVCQQSAGLESVGYVTNWSNRHVEPRYGISLTG